MQGVRRRVNVVEGLELHAEVLSAPEQALMERHIEGWVARGHAVWHGLDCLPAPFPMCLQGCYYRSCQDKKHTMESWGRLGILKWRKSCPAYHGLP